MTPGKIIIVVDAKGTAHITVEALPPQDAIMAMTSCSLALMKNVFSKVIVPAGFSLPGLPGKPPG